MKSSKPVRPTSAQDLSLSERRLLDAFQELGFGRFESVRIRGGELILDPAPAAVQVLKFGGAEGQISKRSAEFELKESLAQFFEYVRGVDDSDIRCLEVRHGLPFSMEIEYRISREMPDVKGEHVEAA